MKSIYIYLGLVLKLDAYKKNCGDSVV